jgi:hypothetical protein
MATEKISQEPQITTKNKCAHPACSCAAEEGSRYCGPYCEGARDKIELSCKLWARQLRGALAPFFESWSRSLS